MQLKKLQRNPFFYILLIAISFFVLYKLGYIQINLSGNNQYSLYTPQPFYFNDPFFNGVKQPSTPEPDPNEIFISVSDSWKTYQSKKIGYEIQIPPGWHGRIDEHERVSANIKYNRDYIDNLRVSPETHDTICPESVEITFPVTIQAPPEAREEFIANGLPGIEKHYLDNKTHYGKLDIYYIQIHNKNTLVVSTRNPIIQKEFRGSWCGHNSKNVYVQLDANRILSIFANWDKDTIYNTEALFDQMLKTLKFL